jgi:alkaline phosphatase
LRHLLERCEELGMATGVVTSVQFSHATPAGFVAHNEKRANCEQIAREMILASPVDVIMGCGHPLYDNDGNRTAEPISFGYVGGEDLWDKLVAGSAGAWEDADGDGRLDVGEWVDADHNGQADDEWTLAESRADFHKLADGPAPGRVIGIPRVHKTLQQERSGDAKAAPYGVPLNKEVPTLAEMTRAALNVLDDDPDGLLIMIEGGAVDWAGHDNQAGRMIEEQLAFNDAVDAAVEWVESRSNWDETVLVVTADHETGYLTAAPGAWSHQRLVSGGPLQVPTMAWNSANHTNSLVPFCQEGPLGSAFEARVVGTDPHFGRYIDNTAVGAVLLEALGGPGRRGGGCVGNGGCSGREAGNACAGCPCSLPDGASPEVPRGGICAPHRATH